MYKATDYNFFRYQLTTLEPLNIGFGEQLGNLRKTLDYIPGATIRGRLASLYIKNYGPPDSTTPENPTTPDFRKLFFSGDLLFLNAYPLHPTLRTNSIPMPYTIYGCKYFGNQVPNGLPEDNHGLIETVAQKPDKTFKCPHLDCLDPPRHKDGYLTSTRDTLYNFKPVRRIDNHNNLQNEDFFAVESIETDCSFSAYIAIKKNASGKPSEEIIDFLHEHIQGGSEHRLGAGKSPGNGLCSFSSLIGINQTNHLFTIPEEAKKGDFLHILCYGDLIIRDDLGHFLSVLPAEKLHTELELIPARSFWKTDTTRRFITGLGMPESTRLTIQKGSVFTYQWKESVTHPELPLTVGESPEYGHGILVYNHHLREITA